MRIQKFQAADMREAIAQVKRALGPEAIIVATRDIRRGLLGSGVEVTAAVDAPAHEEPEIPAPAPAPAIPAATGGLSEADVERILLPLRSELRSLRAVIRPAPALKDDTLRAEIEALRREIASLSRSPALAPRAEAAAADIAEALRSPDLCAASTSRIVCLVGPTGVGKTTTIAKLAARAALIERRRVALVTLDTYRVGGEEQMRVFASMMGVPLHVVSGPTELAAKLPSLRRMERIFIDTSGRSPRDANAIAELEGSLAVIDGVEVHLTLPAASSLVSIEKTVERYRGLEPRRLLFTKIDEADDLTALALAPARTGLPVTWLATGQRVPEDLEDASPSRVSEIVTHGFQGSEEVAA
jgi:flagellar biosynthesis protein FlhF